jgi:SAM-dependent methyltransferase
MRENYFDEPVAERYDEDPTGVFDPAVVETTVAFLAEQAEQAEPAPAQGDRRVLEFAIGTGRIALPLSRRGIEVKGIDLSEAMASRLRAKPGGDRIDVTIGDITSTRVDGGFSLVYLVYNVIENLTSQDDQVECFRNAAAHLAPGGRFVIEVEVPALRRLPPGETVRPFTVTPTRFGFDEFDTPMQGLVSHHYWVEGGELRTVSMPFRYVWPSELDLMARIAGLTLRERWGDWNREPFTAESTKHVSVWDKREP